VGRPLLLAAAVASFALAVFHVVVTFVGAPAYRYFGAGEQMAREAELGSFHPAAITLGIAVVFAVFGAYALSGAGVIARPPLVRLGLCVIGTIYAVRGLAIIPQLMAPGMPLLRRNVVFSAISLAIGLLYLAGAATARPRAAR